MSLQRCLCFINVLFTKLQSTLHHELGLTQMMLDLSKGDPV